MLIVKMGDKPRHIECACGPVSNNPIPSVPMKSWFLDAIYCLSGTYPSMSVGWLVGRSHCPEVRRTDFKKKTASVQKFSDLMWNFSLSQLLTGLTRPKLVQFWNVGMVQTCTSYNYPHGSRMLRRKACFGRWCRLKHRTEFLVALASIEEPFCHSLTDSLTQTNDWSCLFGLTVISSNTRSVPISDLRSNWTAYPIQHEIQDLIWQ